MNDTTIILTTTLAAGTFVWLLWGTVGLLIYRNPESASEKAEGRRAAIILLITPVWPLIIPYLFGLLVVRVAQSLRNNLRNE